MKIGVLCQESSVALLRILLRGALKEAGCEGDVQITAVSSAQEASLLVGEWRGAQLPDVLFSEFCLAGEHGGCGGTGESGGTENPSSPAIRRRIVGLGRAVVMHGEWVVSPPPKSVFVRAVAGKPLVDLADAHRPMAGRIAQSVWEMQQELEKMLKTTGFEEAARIAHSLKGVGMSFQIPQLEQVGGGVQHAIEVEDAAALDECMNSLAGLVHMLERLAADCEAGAVL